MSSNITVEPSLATVQEDIAALKRDFATLIGHLKSGATTSAQGAAEQIEAEVSRVYHAASSDGCKTANALGQQIEKQPVLALLIVLGVGYLGCRLLAR